MHINELQYAR